MDQDSSIRRLGALASIGVAACYLGSGVSALLMPPELQARPDVSPHEFWMVLSGEPTAHLFFHWTWVAAGLFGLGAVPAISLMVWRVHAGATLWSGLAALLGFAVNARSHLMEAAWDRRIIPHYQDADPAFQQAVHVVAGLALDVPDGVLTYGAVGVWIGVVSALALRSDGLPRPFAHLGFVAAGALVAGMVGYALLVRPLVVLSIGGGNFLFVPAWFMWAGYLLWHHAAPHPGAAELGRAAPRRDA
jgi:hypothetical protein